MDCMAIIQIILAVTGAFTWCFLIIVFVLKAIGIITINTDSDNNDDDNISRFS